MASTSSAAATTTASTSTTASSTPLEPQSPTFSLSNAAMALLNTAIEISGSVTGATMTPQQQASATDLLAKVLALRPIVDAAGALASIAEVAPIILPPSEVARLSAKLLDLPEWKDVVGLQALTEILFPLCPKIVHFLEHPEDCTGRIVEGIPPFPDTMWPPGPECTTPAARGPLEKEIAMRLTLWSTTGIFPITFKTMKMFLVQEDDASAVKRHLDSLTPAVRDAVAHPTVDAVRSLFASLGMPGVMRLLGVRRTVGTANKLPPPIEVLIQSCCQLNAEEDDGKSSNKLTVIGRALSKHCQRSRDGWWGDGLSGTEEKKNQMALDALRRILANTAWLNIHQLPHNIVIYEVRNAEGYGARWLADPPYEFRGFLEPQMADGHDKGWIH
ncbi:ASCH domain protein [Pelomyxa schiedti]|nr:ASCH domain protein [Pelomyxa schiedti]